MLEKSFLRKRFISLLLIQVSTIALTVFSVVDQSIFQYVLLASFFIFVTGESVDFASKSITDSKVKTEEIKAKALQGQSSPKEP